MKYSHLGRSGLSVSRLCLGTMNFGPQTGEAAAHSIAALSAGMTAVRTDSPAHQRLMLTKEFLEFVEVEMSALLVRWENRVDSSKVRA